MYTYLIYKYKNLQIRISTKKIISHRHMCEMDYKKPPPRLKIKYNFALRYLFWYNPRFQEHGKSRPNRWKTNYYCWILNVYYMHYIILYILYDYQWEAKQAY